MRIPLLNYGIVVLIALSGCSSTPTSVSERRAVPSSRILQPALLQPSAERSCRLSITRDRGFVAAGASITAYLDGKPVARLGTSETVIIYATPGRHFVGARYRYGLGDSPAEKECFLALGAPTSLRLSIDNDGNLDVKAQSELLY